ncbi:SDR family NAD(P)-dependent oxidoreductase [Actinokineospora iranica]|nr:SDR family NAD(P)-dependent oxidoreductase [Actinokineospora iranica]
MVSRGIYSRPRTSQERLRRAVEGKTVLITGASQGIGRATASRLAAAGAQVVLTARNESNLRELEEEIRAAGGEAAAYPVDLSQPELIDEMVDKVLAKHAKVDILVNNAGHSIRRSIDLCYDRYHDFHRMTAVNYLGPVKLTLRLLPVMRAAGAGKIVNVSTFAIRTPPFPRWGGYHASKAAFDVWLRAIGPEIRADGVRICSVYMGMVDTAMTAHTPSLHRLPTLTVADAAGIVCDGAAGNRRALGPWWCAPLEAGSVFVGRPLDAVFSRLYQRSSDTDAARRAIL